MIDLVVNTKKRKELNEQFEKYGIKESDIEEKFIYSSGNGGQNVNKVATAVYLKHLSTGIKIKCSKGRTQGLNRFFARCLLVKKIDEQILGRMSERQQKIKKLRKQKSKCYKRYKKKDTCKKTSGYFVKNNVSYEHETIETSLRRT
ncbi:MAG: peptide chain release factor-like protein [Endomicrobium sp.]|jgi:protein subunit release factor B|nr:peptide chain release factor-like protein [Endomicrobium sp.]